MPYLCGLWRFANAYMELKNKRDQQQTKPQKETYKRLIQIEDKKLDGLISKLYGAENCRREDLDEE